jgi:hypothetical protein
MMELRGASATAAIDQPPGPVHDSAAHLALRQLFADPRASAPVIIRRRRRLLPEGAGAQVQGPAPGADGAEPTRAPRVFVVASEAAAPGTVAASEPAAAPLAAAPKPRRRRAEPVRRPGKVVRIVPEPGPQAVAAQEAATAAEPAPGDEFHLPLPEHDLYRSVLGGLARTRRLLAEAEAASRWVF